MIGIDISRQQIENAVSLGKRFKSGCEFLVGDAESLPLKDKVFDGIISVGMLEYMDKPEVIFQEVRRVLAENGVTILTCSNKSIFAPFICVLKKAFNKKERGRGWNIYSYTTEQITQKTRRFGFHTLTFGYSIFIISIRGLSKVLEQITRGRLVLEESALGRRLLHALLPLEVFISRSLLSRFLGSNLIAILRHNPHF